jgi:methyl-accepting chemotaxis protein
MRSRLPASTENPPMRFAETIGRWRFHPFWDQFRCRLCWRITFVVFAAIVLVEGAILIPSYLNYERDLLKSLDDSGRATLRTAFALADDDADAAAILAVLERATRGSQVVGGDLFSVDGEWLGAFGERRDVTNRDRAFAGTGDRVHSAVWTPGQLGAPYLVLARLDASAVPGALAAFVWRIAGLVLLIGAVVTAVTMFIVGQTILSPMLALRDNLVRAGSDAGPGAAHPLVARRADEWGEVVEAFNGMLEHLAAHTPPRPALKTNRPQKDRRDPSLGAGQPRSGPAYPPIAAE